MNHILTLIYCLINVEYHSKAYCEYYYAMYAYCAINLLIDLHRVLWVRLSLIVLLVVLLAV